MDDLEKAVEDFLEFIHTPHADLSYEARQELRREYTLAMIVALAKRKAQVAA